jgi:hypothetical protein
MIAPDIIQGHIKIADDVIQIIIRQVPTADDHIQGREPIADIRTVEQVDNDITDGQ